jgi:hypothetical protein
MTYGRSAKNGSETRNLGVSKSTMSRLFTFGCSFTQYWRWPTWADALGREHEYFENWGICGAGNALIFNSVMECHQRNRIHSSDRVVVMWTNVSREDRYVRTKWLPMGNVYWTAGSRLPQEYVRHYACERGYLIRDLAMIFAIKTFLQSTGCDWKFLSMVPLDKSNHASGLGENPYQPAVETRDVRDLYQATLDEIAPSMFEIIFKQDWSSRPGIADQNTPTQRDFHPTPLEHVEYLQTVLPGMISATTQEWMTECDRRARNNTLQWSEPNRPEVRL